MRKVKRCPLLKIMKGVDLMVIRWLPSGLVDTKSYICLPPIRSLEKYRFSSHLTDKQKNQQHPKQGSHFWC